MNVLIDTNVLLRAWKSDDPLHESAANAVRFIAFQGHQIVIVPQCLYEFYVVATRPAAQNGLGREPADVDKILDQFLVNYTLLNDLPDVFTHWKMLVANHSLRGKPSHDARIIAAMSVHQIRHLLTFNVSDFARYGSNVTIVNAATVDPRIVLN
jgi:predicted nucleic acid-binding protein